MSSHTPIKNAAQTPAKPARPRFDYGSDAQESQINRAAVLADPRVAPVALPFVILRDKPLAGVFIALFGFLFYMLYATNLAALVGLWSKDPGWSHGFLIPVLSAGLVYLRWDEIRHLKVKAAWQGLAILLIGVTGQVLFAATSTTHMMNLSMLVVLFGVTLWVLGWDYLRILWLPISYLVFAINPPGELYQRVTEPMQRIAATLASKILMIANIPSEPRGTTLEVTWNNEPKMIEVADACSGMRMLIAFVALAVVLAYSSHRPNWQRIFLSMCAIPVAILCNALRVAIIAYLVAQDTRVESPWAHGAAHAYVGLAMLIPALLMLLAIGWILDRVFVDDSNEAPAGAKA